MATEGWLSFVSIMTHIESLIKKIQLLSDVLQPHWISTSEYPSSRSINHLTTFCILLVNTEMVLFQHLPHDYNGLESISSIVIE